MALNFDKYAREGNTFLKQYAKEMAMEADLPRAGRILTSVLHAFRNLIPPVESLQLMAQLPMFLKGVYVHGWSLKKPEKKIRNQDDFFRSVREQQALTANNDFGYDLSETGKYVEATFIFLRQYVSEGEMKDIRDTLPTALKPLLHFPMTY